jgi:nicotinamidase-related amidase
MSRLIASTRSQLLVIDAQRRLIPALVDPEGLSGRITLLARAAGLMDVPVTVSEQYPQGLGHTLEAVAAALPDGHVVLPKRSFSCLDEEPLRSRLETLRIGGRDRLILCGAESHVCVLQTALAACEAGFDVAWVCDASSSRRRLDHEAGLARMAAAGIGIVTAEMVAFEWVSRSDAPLFRAISTLIKDVPV